MSIAIEPAVPGFTLNVSGSEMGALQIKIAYDGSNPKFGMRPLIINEYWVVNPPSPCYCTLPPDAVDVLYYDQHFADFDWDYGRFGCATNLITLEETSGWAVRNVELQVFAHDPKSPKTTSLHCGCVILTDADL